MIMEQSKKRLFFRDARERCRHINNTQIEKLNTKINSNRRNRSKNQRIVMNRVANGSVLRLDMGWNVIYRAVGDWTQKSIDLWWIGWMYQEANRQFHWLKRERCVRKMANLTDNLHTHTYSQTHIRCATSSYSSNMTLTIDKNALSLTLSLAHTHSVVLSVFHSCPLLLLFRPIRESNEQRQKKGIQQQNHTHLSGWCLCCCCCCRPMKYE